MSLSSAPSGPLAVDLLGLGTAVPPHRLTQDAIAETAARLFGDRLADFPPFFRLFERAGIECRYSARPLDWFTEDHGWADRMAAYQAAAGDLFMTVIARALEEAGVAADQVDGLVFASSSGFATPGLEALLAGRLGLRADLLRVPLFGLGCAAGVAGLTIATQLAAARPGRVMLFVTVELCSLAFRRDDAAKAHLVATALFGDGAAAVVLRAGPDRAGDRPGGFATITGCGQHLFPDSRELMGWRVDDQGFGLILSPDLPLFLRRHLPAALADLWRQCAVAPETVTRLLCHPGGPKVLAALETILDLPAGRLDHERAVLAGHGNMSAPTILFVLDQARRAGLADRFALLALGPGFAAHLLTCRRKG